MVKEHLEMFSRFKKFILLIIFHKNNLVNLNNRLKLYINEILIKYLYFKIGNEIKSRSDNNSLHDKQLIVYINYKFVICLIDDTV